MNAVPENAIDATLQKPKTEWTREERISWAVAKFGADAAFYWNIYQVGARNSRQKVTEVDGLDVENYDDEIVAQFGGGRYFRQLMVRNVRNDYGSIVAETTNLSPALGRLPVLNPPPTPVSGLEDRLSRIERALDRFANGMPPAPMNAAPDPAAQAQATMTLAMQMAQMMSGATRPPTPVEELLKVKALAEKLIERDEERGERDGGVGDYREIGRMILGVVNGFREAMPARAAAPTPNTEARPALAAPSHTAPGAVPVASPGAVRAVVSSAPVQDEPRYLREPFPGCFDIVEAVRANPALVPVVVGDSPADDCEALIEVMFEKIEAASGDPCAVADRFGARGIVDAFVSVYPEAEPFRAMMERAAVVFVQAAHEEIEGDDSASVANNAA